MNLSPMILLHLSGFCTIMSLVTTPSGNSSLRIFACAGHLDRMCMLVSASSPQRSQSGVSSVFSIRYLNSFSSFAWSVLSLANIDRALLLQFFSIFLLGPLLRPKIAFALGCVIFQLVFLILAFTIFRVTIVADWSSFVASFARLSALSFPSVPQWDGIQRIVVST